MLKCLDLWKPPSWLCASHSSAPVSMIGELNEGELYLETGYNTRWTRPPFPAVAVHHSCPVRDPPPPRRRELEMVRYTSDDLVLTFQSTSEMIQRSIHQRTVDLESVNCMVSKNTMCTSVKQQLPGNAL